MVRSLVLGFILLLPLTAFAGPYGDLDARLNGQPDSAVVSALRQIAKDDPEAGAALSSGAKASRSYIALRATLESDPNVKPPTIAVSKGDERIASSWLARAFERLKPPKIDFPETRGGTPTPGLFGGWLTVLMWIVLICLGGLAVFFLARSVKFSSKRRSKSIVEDEPLRSADAWLEEANGLIAAGRYREAVRGLYVAGLMRLDEAGVARFDRHQTNWEHLRRIEASPKRPEGSDVRGATGRFDRCWYGHLPTSIEDASAMRGWYDGLVATLSEEKP